MSASSCQLDVQGAFGAVRKLLLAERDPAGHWVGELAASALSTATAISALSIVDRESGNQDHAALIRHGCDWLMSNRNPNGGWGDTTDSVSNLSTTILVLAALRLAGRIDSARPGMRAVDYVQAHGGYAAVQSRYGQDKTFAVPILTNAALAKLVDWRDVSALPFELAVFPQSWYRFLRMPVVSYAIPALVAIGQAHHFNCPPRNPLVRRIRAACVGPTLRVLSRIQPASGGYLEAIPLTSFVLMSLASTGRQKSDVAINAIRFLKDTVREDGSWPIDTNLATWNTTLAVNGVGVQGWEWDECLAWLLSCQNKVRHPFTGSPPGGWGWTDLSGAVPDADDTPGALLALHKFYRALPLGDGRSGSIESAAQAGMQWLLKLQNSDGGWPTFCKGWGKLPFDRSGADLTAHVLRALHAWQNLDPKLAKRIAKATTRGIAYLTRRQRSDGSWIPLWFGNQYHPHDDNPIYGTSKVLLAYAGLGLGGEPKAVDGLRFLLGQQNKDGGWGKVGDAAATSSDTTNRSGVEETSVALEAVIRACVAENGANSQETRLAIQNGLNWLIRAIHSGEISRPSPIGLYFAKLWYHERLYPLTFAAAALRAAVEHADEIKP